MAMAVTQKINLLNSPIKLIAGLGNPGQQYESTRHNAGFWFVQQCADQAGGRWQQDAKFHGLVCRVNIREQDVRLLMPGTFMNLSGRSVQAIAQFYKIKPENILVVHDELDLPVGAARLKFSGGHGGHNGLRDIHQQIGCDYWRLRIGIGHPGDRSRVTSYVLSTPSRAEKQQIDEAISVALCQIELVVLGEQQKAMNQLNG